MISTDLESRWFRSKDDSRGMASLFADLDELRRSATEPAEKEKIGPDWAAGARGRIRAIATSLRVVARRMVRVAPIVATSLVLHAAALAVAERAYAPYSLSRTGEYVHEPTTVDDTASRRLSISFASARRI